MSLSLKIDNKFIVLPDDIEISIEASNPIFSDAGAKTYLFEIPVESLRYIIGNADEIYGESLYDTLEGKRAEIYIDGVQFFSGVVNLEDSISVEEGKIAVSIASGNLEFAQMIDNMNCRDVKLKDKIEYGYIYDSLNVKYGLSQSTKDLFQSASKTELSFKELEFDFFFPENYIAVKNCNISEPYPAAYCNIRRAYSILDSSSAEGYIKEDEFNRLGIYPTGGNEKILTLEYNSMRSAPCFYVLYFIDCLAHHLGLSLNNSTLDEIGDAKRLAFVNTTCNVERIGDVQPISMYIDNMLSSGYKCSFKKSDFFKRDSVLLFRQKVVATSENFPDVSVSDVINAFQNIFNVRFVLDGTSLSLVYVPNILCSSELCVLPATIHSANKVENRMHGFRLTYDAGEEDTSYNFSFSSDVETRNNYAEVIKTVSANNPTVYIDVRNGNAYVTKVSEDAVKKGEEKELNPVLFEIGGYADAIYGDCSVDDYVEEHRMGFLPIINIDVNGRENIDSAKIDTSSKLENIYALNVEGLDELGWTSEDKTTSSVLDLIENTPPQWEVPTPEIAYYITEVSGKKTSASFSYFDYNPEEKIESGLMLGIMRGPGSDSEPEVFGKNFDNEGNYRIAYTAENYAFTSDSIDNCNRDFDYNGKGEGVGDDGLKGRMSLKLRAGKYDKDGNPIRDKYDKQISIHDRNRAERGIYDKFWKEYAYFTVNKKIIRITCSMEIADIVNLDWVKRYKIGQWTGFIANYSFNVNKYGMSEIELEMYYI